VGFSYSTLYFSFRRNPSEARFQGGLLRIEWPFGSYGTPSVGLDGCAGDVARRSISHSTRLHQRRDVPQYDLSDYRWLIGSDGTAWLRRASDDARDTSPVTLTARFRRELSASRTHLVLEQVELRARARAKFAMADEMFFTRVGLEQATDEAVARHKAERFPRGSLRVDMCCGIGGDLAALATGGPAVGADCDRVVALLAAENLRRLDRDAGQVVVGDVTRLALPPDAAWHVDPDRRPAGRRSTQIAWHSPDRAAVERMLEHAPQAAIKLAPAAEVPAEWKPRAESQWISRARQCRQLVVWFDRLAQSPGQHSATVLSADSLDAMPQARTVTGQPGPIRTVARRIERYVFEPDPAVLAAGLTWALAEQHQLKALAAGAVYLTGDRPIDDAALGCFEVDEVLPLDKKRLKRLLADRGIGRLEIKKRGLDIDPERLRRELRLKGNAAAVLILARRGDSASAIIARRVEWKRETGFELGQTPGP